MSWKDITNRPLPPPERGFKLVLPSGEITLTDRHGTDDWWTRAIITVGELHSGVANSPPFQFALDIVEQRLMDTLAVVRAAKAELRQTSENVA